MKRFLINIAIFSTLVCIILGVGEFIARRVDNPYAYKSRWMSEYAGDVSTLILGSSHTYYGLRPELLADSTFNLAQVSQTAEYNLALLKKYLPACTHLKRVIVTVSYSTFREPPLESGPDARLAVEYKTQMHLNLHSDFSKYNLLITDWPAYCGRLRQVLAKTHEQTNQCDSLGFGLGYDISDRSPQWESRASARVEELTYTASSRASEVMEVYREIFSLCRRHGVECILLTTPVWHTFRQVQEAGQAEEMICLANELATEEGVRYLNYYADARFREEDFHDVDHLSPRGADKLTDIVSAELR
ncbi:MAG: hypothetical protein NC217_04615 [Muribaculaceae bacterium]|nr:hypothetical protein [Muribaculaceae bacterium]